MFCKQCGQQISDTALFCTGCGTKTARAAQQMPEPAQPQQTVQPQQTAQPQYPQYTPPQPQYPQYGQPVQPPRAPIYGQPLHTAQQSVQQPVQQQYQQPAQQQFPQYAPQQPYASQPPQAQSGLMQFKTIAFAVILILLCIVTVGLYIGKVRTIEGSKKTKSYSHGYTFKIVYDAYRENDDKDYGVLESLTKSIEEHIDELDSQYNDDKFSMIVLLVTFPISILCSVLILVEVICAIVAFTKKKERKAWGNLMLGWIFALIAKLGALAFAVSVMIDSEDSSYASYSVSLWLIGALVLIVAGLVLSVMYKNRSQDAAPQPMRPVQPMQPYGF